MHFRALDSHRPAFAALAHGPSLRSEGGGGRFGQIEGCDVFQVPCHRCSLAVLVEHEWRFLLFPVVSLSTWAIHFPKRTPLVRYLFWGRKDKPRFDTRPSGAAQGKTTNSKLRREAAEAPGHKRGPWFLVAPSHPVP